jgi:hypothetical protein
MLLACKVDLELNLPLLANGKAGHTRMRHCGIVRRRLTINDRQPSNGELFSARQQCDSGFDLVVCSTRSLGSAGRGDSGGDVVQRASRCYPASSYRRLG